MPYVLLFIGIFWGVFRSPIFSQVPPKEPGIYRIGILGCHKQFEPAPALVKYIEMDPDLCLWIGDNIYADTEHDPAFLDSCYRALAEKPAFKTLYSSFPFLATWDDHDFGLNNAGKEYGLKAESKERFRKFWNLDTEIPASQPGIYYAKTIPVGLHLLQVIMLDVRYNRDAPGESGDVLGAEQWNWLENTLEEPADFRIVVSGFQIMLDKSSRSETWAKFPKARERLFELIRKKAGQRVVFLTGDQHYGEVNRMKQGLDYDALEFQFAGINQIEAPEFNSFRVSSVCASLHSYAMMELQWDSTGSDVPHIRFRIYNAENDHREVDYRVNFSELETAISFSSPSAFVNQTTCELKHTFPNLQIRYTLDGTPPKSSSPVYRGGIEIRNTTVVKAALFSPEGYRRSTVFEHPVQRVSPHKAINRVGLKKGLTYAYFENTFTQLPDFDTLVVAKSGIISDFEVEKIAQREDQYAISMKGYLQVPETGMYTFFTQSDDGSCLYLHGKLVVNNDGSHSLRARSGSIALEEGLHPLELTYFEDILEQALSLSYRLPSGEIKPITFEHLFYSVD